MHTNRIAGFHSCLFVSIRGQSLFQFGLCDSLNFNDLHAAGQARHDADMRARHSGDCGEEADAFFIGFAVHRRSRQVELVGVAETAGEGRPLGARMHFHRETRHSTLALKLATPAATRVSTTSKAMASSSQSWLDPSAFWVATVRV